MKIYSFEEVAQRMSGNRLRQFPGAQKGRNRLFPVPRPRIDCPPSICDGSSFFVIGACFARSIEKGLKEAGRTVLSSQVGLGMEGSEEDQLTRYNVSGLDIAMNEIRWALDAHSVPNNASLMPFRGEILDLQLHWSFAHNEEKALKFRKIYNTSFKPITEADVIVLTLSNTRQWFDRHSRIYINTMPSGSMRDEYPGRFELHEFSGSDIACKITHMLDLIRENSEKLPSFLIGVSPVYQANSPSSGDALTDLFNIKAVLRSAVQEVCQQAEDVAYLPCLEAGVMSDFTYSYMPSSPNHAAPILAERVVADALHDMGVKDSRFEQYRARVFAETALMAGDFDSAIALCEPSIPKDEVADPALILIYTEALAKAKRSNEAMPLLLDFLSRSNSEERPAIWNRAVNLLNTKQLDDVEILYEFASGLNVDTRLLTDRLSDKSEEVSEAGKSLTEAINLIKAERADEALGVLESIAHLTEVLPVKMKEIFLLSKFRALWGAREHSRLLSDASRYLATERPVSAQVFLDIVRIVRKDLADFPDGAIHEFLAVVEDVSSNHLSDPRGPNAVESLKSKLHKLEKKSSQAFY